MVIVFFISYFALNYILIIVTSLIGGYCIMRTATFWFNHYPSESELYDLLNKGEKEAYKENPSLITKLSDLLVKNEQ